MSVFHGRVRVLASLLFLLSMAAANASVATAAQPITVNPVLGSATASDDEPETLVISGHGFSPGGLVYIVLYDHWGTQLYETRWVTASERLYQPTDSFDPGRAFVFDLGGDIEESFAIPAAAEAAYAAVEHGGGRSTTMAGVSCDMVMMVRAFDRDTATWSNLLDADLECAG